MVDINETKLEELLIKVLGICINRALDNKTEIFDRPHFISQMRFIRCISWKVNQDVFSIILNKPSIILLYLMFEYGMLTSTLMVKKLKKLKHRKKVHQNTIFL